MDNVEHPKKLIDKIIGRENHEDEKFTLNSFVGWIKQIISKRGWIKKWWDEGRMTWEQTRSKLPKYQCLGFFSIVCTFSIV